MLYAVFLKRSAEREMECLPRAVHDRLIEKIQAFKDNPRPRGIQKLHALDGYRVSVGHYRILFIIDDAEKRVDIMAVGHRRDVYGR
jgi:mRNA interferase RelE/StbE